MRRSRINLRMALNFGVSLSIAFFMIDCMAQDRTTDAVKSLRAAITQRETFVLYSVDHSVIAAQATEFAQEIRRRNQAIGSTGVEFNGGNALIPPDIKALRPSRVKVFQDRVNIACGSS